MHDYIRALKTHPGLPIAAALPVMGFVAGLQVSIERGMFGAVLMLVFWIPVLVTNRGRKP